MEDEVFRNGLICGQGTLGHCEDTWDDVIVAEDPRTVGVGESVLDLISIISSRGHGLWQGGGMSSIEGSHHTCDRCISPRCLSNSDIVTVTLLGNTSFADSLDGDILAYCVGQSESEQYRINIDKTQKIGSTGDV